MQLWIANNESCTDCNDLSKEFEDFDGYIKILVYLYCT